MKNNKSLILKSGERIYLNVCVLTCADSSRAVSVGCPVLTVATVAPFWLSSRWMHSPDIATPSIPNPTWHKHRGTL